MRCEKRIPQLLAQSGEDRIPIVIWSLSVQGQYTILEPRMQDLFLSRW